MLKKFADCIYIFVQNLKLEYIQNIYRSIYKYRIYAYICIYISVSITSEYMYILYTNMEYIQDGVIVN